MDEAIVTCPSAKAEPPICVIFATDVPPETGIGPPDVVPCTVMILVFGAPAVPHATAPVLSVGIDCMTNVVAFVVANATMAAVAPLPAMIWKLDSAISYMNPIKTGRYCVFVVELKISFPGMAGGATVTIPVTKDTPTPNNDSPANHKFAVVPISDTPTLDNATLRPGSDTPLISNSAVPEGLQIATRTILSN